MSGRISRPMTEADLVYHRPPDTDPGHLHHEGHCECGNDAHAPLATASQAPPPRRDSVTNQLASLSISEAQGDHYVVGPGDLSRTIDTIQEEDEESDIADDDDEDDNQPIKSRLQLEIEAELDYTRGVLERLGMPYVDGTAPESSTSSADRPKLAPAPQGFSLGCAYCLRTAEQFGSPLNKICKNCVRASPYMRYCTKSCQKLDWPRHKKVCGIVIDPSTGRPTQLMPARLVIIHWQSAWHEYEWTSDVFTKVTSTLQQCKLIIDAYRILDEIKRGYQPGFFPLSQYIVWLRGYSFKGLRHFLDRTFESTVLDEYMPLDWTIERRNECEEVALKLYHWDDVQTTVHREINAINRYGGPRVRIALRAAAAKIDGDLSPEVKERLDAHFALDAMAIMGELSWM